MAEQIQLSFVAPTPAITFPLCDLVPAGLEREAVVRLDEPSLFMGDEAAAAYIRQHHSPEQVTAEINRISQLGVDREAFGEYGVFLFGAVSSGYPCVDSATSALNWMYLHELKRLNQLKLALPSSAELAVEARQRIQARIAARKAERVKTQPCNS